MASCKQYTSLKTYPIRARNKARNRVKSRAYLCVSQSDYHSWPLAHHSTHFSSYMHIILWQFPIFLTLEVSSNNVHVCTSEMVIHHPNFQNSLFLILYHQVKGSNRLLIIIIRLQLSLFAGSAQTRQGGRPLNDYSFFIRPLHQHFHPLPLILQS